MVTLLKIGNGYVNPDRKEFLINGSSDVSGLPNSKAAGSSINGKCAPGSIAYTPDLKLIYILGNDDQWHKAETA